MKINPEKTKQEKMDSFVLLYGPSTENKIDYEFLSTFSHTGPSLLSTLLYIAINTNNESLNRLMKYEFFPRASNKTHKSILQTHKSTQEKIKSLRVNKQDFLQVIAKQTN